jgi:segregation and condensation protein B
MSIKSQIESILFSQAKPLSIRQLQNILEISPEEIQQNLEQLILEYNVEGRGINLITNGDKYQFTTSPENSELIQKILKQEITSELSRPSLETLTVIAYRGPITKAELEQIRGVNCSLIIRNLLMRGLVESFYDKQKDYTYYNITLDFMRYLGINKIEGLPDYERLNNDERLLKLLDENKEEGEVIGIIENIDDEEIPSELEIGEDVKNDDEVSGVEVFVVDEGVEDEDVIN